MKITSEHTKMGIVILLGIIIAGVVLYAQQEPEKKPYEGKFPPLRELNFGEDIAGTTNLINSDNGWSLYENEVLGFKIKHPSERILWESFNNNPTFGESYNIDLSEGEFEVININITPARFHTIEEWVKNDPEYINNTRDGFNYVFVRHKISGVNAVTKYAVPEFPYITDMRIQRDTHIIKNDIMYVITTRDIPSEEYERIWNSFKFLD